MVGNAAHCAHGKVPVAVCSNVTAEETAEVVNYNGAHLCAVSPFEDVGRQGCEEAVGQWLTIDALYQRVERQSGVGKETVGHHLGQKSLKQGIDKLSPKHRPTALIAEDIAERWRVHHYFAAVIQARVGSCAQYGRHSHASSAHCPCRSKQVTVRLHPRCRGESLGQKLLHSRDFVGAAPASVEEHGLWRCSLQEWQQLASHYGRNSRRVLMERVYALGGDAPLRTSFFGQTPRGFGASAVCYKYHNFTKSCLTLPKVAALLCGKVNNFE